MSLLKRSPTSPVPESLPTDPSEPHRRIEDTLKNKEFHSWEEFCIFFDNWCEEKKVLFCKKTRVLHKYRTALVCPSPELVKTFVYSKVHLTCKYYRIGGRYVQFRKGDSRPCCPAYIELKLAPREDRLIVTNAVLEHNHELCPIEFAHSFKKGNLMLSFCIPVYYTNELSTRFLDMYEVPKLQRYSRPPDGGVQDTLKELENLFRADLGTKIKMVFVENRVIMKCVFFITSHMKMLCQKFPQVLCVDKITYLSDEWDLYTVLCEDANGKGRECVYCIARKETPDIIRFIVASLLQSVPDIKLKVNCMVMAADTEDICVIKDLLPKTEVQFCRMHVVDTLYNKAMEMNVASHINIWDFLCELANSPVPLAYSEHVSKMKSMFPEEFVQYFKETWHFHKKMWVKCWASEKNKGNTFSSIVRSHQQKLVSELRSSSTVAEYIRGLHNLQTLKVVLTDLEEGKVCARYQETFSPDLADLIKEELSLAKSGCYVIREAEPSFLLNDGILEFIVNKEQTSCSCSFYNSTLLPCRHIFVVRLWNGEALFDKNLLGHQPESCGDN